MEANEAKKVQCDSGSSVAIVSPHLFRGWHDAVILSAELDLVSPSQSPPFAFPCVAGHLSGTHLSAVIRSPQGGVLGFRRRFSPALYLVPYDYIEHSSERRQGNSCAVQHLWINEFEAGDLTVASHGQASGPPVFQHGLHLE